MMGVLATCLRLLARVFCLFPLKRRVVLLSRQSHTPSADFRLLAQRLHSDDPSLDVRICCIDSELSGRLAFALHTLRQLWLAQTSQVTVLDGYNPAVCIPVKRKGTYVIQMWHAAGAIKKFGYQCLDTDAGRTSAQAKVARMHMNYDLVVAAGPGATGAYTQTFGYPNKSVRALGLPHIDLLLGRMQDKDAVTALATQHGWLANGRRNVLYAPTLRRDASPGWLTDAVEQLASRLDAGKFNLIVSKHPLTSVDEASLARHDHVHVLTGQSTTSLLPVADVVVTDYSALALEAGLAGTSVLFYVPDIDHYRVSPGLNVDPIEHPWLYGTTDAAEISHALEDEVLLGQIDERYQAFVAKYFEGIEPGADERIANVILGRLH